MTAIDQDAYIPYNAVRGDVPEILEIFDLIMNLTDLDFSPLRADRRTALPEEIADADLLTRMKKIRLAVGGLYDAKETSVAA